MERKGRGRKRMEGKRKKRARKQELGKQKGRKLRKGGREGKSESFLDIQKMCVTTHRHHSQKKIST